MRLFLLLLVIVARSSQAQPFWAHKYTEINDITYGELPRQTLDIIQQGTWTGPPNYFVADKSPKPTLIYIHGGAWHSGKKEANRWSLMPFVQQGWNAVNIEYRVGSNTAPQAAEDVLFAFQWLFEHGANYGIDFNNLVIAGDSAGGHLALVSGLAITNPNHKNYLDKLHIKAIINWFGITDISSLDKYLQQHGRWNYPRLWVGTEQSFTAISKAYSPVNLVTRNSPPVLTIHGKEDKVVPIGQARLLHQKLNEFNVTNRLIEFPNGKHLKFSEAQWQQAYTDVMAFIESNLN